MRGRWPIPSAASILRSGASL